MKKIVYHHYGGADVLSLEETHIPTPAEDELLIKVKAAGVNPVDYKIRNGSMKMIVGGKFPRTPGGEIAGVVQEAGRATTRFKPGDHVFAMLTLQGGGNSEYVCVKENLLCAMPAQMDFRDAAAIPLAALTALQALRDKGNIQKNMKVLINGASGGVGTFAVQIAKAYNCHVTAVCSAANSEWVKQLGADQVVDYTTTDFTSLDQKFDIILDAVAKSKPGKCRKIMKPAARFVSTIPTPGILLRQALNAFFRKKVFGIMCKPGVKDLEVLKKLAEEGRLKPVLDKTYPLHEASLAHAYIETGRVKGKLVLIIA